MIKFAAGVVVGYMAAMTLIAYAALVGDLKAKTDAAAEKVMEARRGRTS